MKIDNKFYRYSIGVLIVLTIIFLLSKLTFIINPLSIILNTLFIPLLFGGFIYYIFRPLVKLIEKTGLKRDLAVILVLLIFVGVLFLLFGYSGSQVAQTFSKSYKDVVSKIEEVQNNFYKVWGNLNLDSSTAKEIEGSIKPYIEKSIQNISKGSFSFISSIANIGSLLILIPIVAFYLLKDGEKFKEGILNIIPDKRRVWANKLFKNIDSTLSTYITGQILVAFCIGIMMFIGYLIIGMQDAFVLSIFAMITSMIPFIGPFLGIIPALLIALITNISLALKVIIVSVVVQQIEGNFITPNIIGNRLNIHPLTVIFLIFISVSLLGILGAFIAIPAYSVVKVIIKSIYVEEK
ncbi:AI-2E family transporter [Clostridium sediminicola]|uniref:AI-2E family transporter n=1 Tax=Clostridium sediminicola TaxID=3114879 RepID=UPI0031F24A70